MSEIDIDRVKDGIGETVVTRADEYATAHSDHKSRAVEIYYAFIGKFLESESPLKAWQSKLYPKAMKPKVLAVWSQFVQAAMANKLMWEVYVRGIETPSAVRSAAGMKNEMNEQAEACRMKEKLKSGFLDKAMYGTLFWQAPVVESQVQEEWEIDQSNQQNAMSQIAGEPVWVPRTRSSDMPSCIHRNYFEMLPWPYSSDPQRGEAVIHRPFISAYDLSELRDQPGYDKAVIDELLRAGAEAPRADDKTDEKMTARGWQGMNRKGFDLIFYAGRIGGEDLKHLPGFENESGRYVEALIWVVNHSIGKKVIKVVPNPVRGKKRPFMVSPYEQLPFESLGVGVGENSVDMAKGIGGTLRMILDGKKIALPQIGVNTRYFKGNELDLSPFGVHAFSDGKPSDWLFALNLPDVTGGLIPLIELLERMHDEITGVPKWTTGVDSKMLNKTATGISMIMNASSQLIRGAIENIDDYIIGPTGEAFYHWNMARPGRPEIKGNFMIKPSGISSLMQKETLNQQLLGLYSLVVNPATQQNPFAMRLIRMVADGMGVKDVDAIMPDPDKQHAFAQQEPEAAAQTLLPSVPPGAQAPTGAPMPGPLMV